MKIKILYEWTGLTSYQGDAWRALAASGEVELKVVVAVREERDGVAFKAAEVLRDLDALVIGSSDRLSVREAERKIRDWLGVWRPDVIYAAGWYNPVTKAVAYAREWETVPKVAGVDMPWRWNFRCLVAPLVLRRYARRFKACYVPGIVSAKYCRWIGFKNVRTGLYAIDTERFRRETAQAKREPDGEYFLYIGRNSSEKRIDLLEAGYAKFRARSLAAGVAAPPLRMYGKGCRDGFVEPKDVPRLMARAKAFILASDFDPWPLVLLEATAAGCPVVASDRCTNAPELGRDWTVFRHGDPDDLARALTEVKPNELDVSEYGCARWVERTLALFREAIG